MDEADRRLRNLTYTTFVELGRAPTADELAHRSQATVAEVEASWRRLHDAHALVLHAGAASGAAEGRSGSELRMLNPFSAVPTAYRVQAGGRWWFANCAWDAFGICAALHTDGAIVTACPDCGTTIETGVVEANAAEESLLFHCLVPAAAWWDDIAFT